MRTVCSPAGLTVTLARFVAQAPRNFRSAARGQCWLNTCLFSRQVALPATQLGGCLMRSNVWGVLLLLLLVVTGAPARADDNEDFRRHYQQALSLYERGQYEESIAAFQRAYALRQLPRLLLNLGQLHRKLGRARDALGYYELYLRVEPNPEAKLKTELDRYIQQTRAMLDAAQRIQAESEVARQQAAQERRLDAASPPLQAGREDGAAEMPAERPNPAPAVGTPRAGSERQGASSTPASRTTQPGGGPPAQLAPDPGEVSSRVASTETRPGPAGRESAKPLHKQWWFWTLIGIGGVGLVAGVAAGIVASQPTVPSSPLGTVRVFSLQLGR